jgi:hypothetical protein
MDDPYTSEYKVEHIIPNDIIRVDFKLGSGYSQGSYLFTSSGSIGVKSGNKYLQNMKRQTAKQSNRRLPVHRNGKIPEP